MVVEEIPAIAIRDEMCSRCTVCLSVCPFEAISRHEEKIVIDLDKCMLCGICGSVCPSGAVVQYYYGSNALIEEVEAKKGMTVLEAAAAGGALLMQDAVYFATTVHGRRLLDNGVEVYALRDDLDARGVLGRVHEGVKVVDYGDAIDLIMDSFGVVV